MHRERVIKFLSSLNLILMLSGYALVTSLFLPFLGNVESASRVVTVPYRAFVLIISITLIFANLKSKFSFPKEVWLIILLWIMYMVRIIYDIELRDGFFITESKDIYYTYLFFIGFIPFFSVLISLKHVDLNRVAIFSLLLSTLTMILSIVLDARDHDNARISGNAALNPISYGQVGTFAVILSGFLMIKKDTKIKFFKFFLLISIVLGFITLGRAASKGPFLAVVFSFLFYLVSKQRIPIVSILVLILLVSILYAFQDVFIDLIGKLSPTLQSRIDFSFNDQSSSERRDLFSLGIDQFLEHPIFGDYFVLFPENGKGIYTHNMIIDIFMSFGFFGGFLIIYLIIKSLFYASKLIKSKNSAFWISFFLLTFINASMVSNPFYMDPLLSVFMALVFNEGKK